MGAHWPFRLSLIAMLSWASINSAYAASPLTRNAKLEIAVRSVVYTPPNSVSIWFGISAISPTVSEARSAVRSRAELLIQLLKSNGVADGALVIDRYESVEVVREQWIEHEDLVEGEIVGRSVRIEGLIRLKDMALTQRIVELLARQGLEVTFNAEYGLDVEMAEKATQRARAAAVRQAQITAIAIAKKQGWRIAEMLPPRQPLPAGGDADLGAPALEGREWGPPTNLTPQDVATDYALEVTFRLVRSGAYARR